MQAFARETRLSETTFVQAPSTPAADYRNRIFTMMEELPFAGHPSLGTAVAVALDRGEDRASYVQQTPAGLQPVDVEIAGDLAKASMLQEAATFRDPLDPAQIAGVLGLTPDDLHPELPVQAVSTGVFHVMVPARDVSVLGRAAPDLGGLRRMRSTTGGVVAYLFHAEGGSVRARGFFENPGAVVEDPATGSAAGPLCAYLDRHAGVREITIAQGCEMGRASRLEARVEDDRVRVGGDAVVVLQGELRL
jgi:trans-2,3-dihydro-3-hydroxyanthranilate isomerase